MLQYALANADGLFSTKALQVEAFEAQEPLLQTAPAQAPPMIY